MRFIGLDPSTKTGFVALNEDGSIDRAKELTGIGKEDPHRMVTLIDEVRKHVRDDDLVCIEGFGFASQQAIQNGGIGWGIRMALFRRNIQYHEVAPMALKKFAGATSNKDADGKPIKADKIEVAKQVLKRWQFESGSENITDAFVLAQIGREIHRFKERREFWPGLFSYQREVIQNVITPKTTSKKSKTKRSQSK
jgi:crossover junction endodeoxyribonuclease RuvC